MPKPLSLDPDTKRKKKKKRKKRKVDYSIYLVPPVIPNNPCPHTTKPTEASACSQCMGVSPSVTHYPPQTDWWGADFVEDISIEEFEGDDDDDDGVEKVYIELDDDDLML